MLEIIRTANHLKRLVPTHQKDVVVQFNRCIRSKRLIEARIIASELKELYVDEKDPRTSLINKLYQQIEI